MPYYSNIVKRINDLFWTNANSGMIRSEEKTSAGLLTSLFLLKKLNLNIIAL